MAIIAADSMTTAVDVDISLHTPDIGTGWTPSAALDTTDIAATNSVQHSQTATVRSAREGTTVGSDAMSVSADSTMNTNNSAHRSGVVVRYNSSNHTDYFSAYAQGNAATVLDIFLVINSGGIQTTLASSGITVATNTVARNLRLDCTVGSPTTLSVYFANSALAFITITDNRLATQNYGGIYGRNTSPRIDNYLCQTVGTSGTVVAQQLSDFIFFMS